MLVDTHCHLAATEFSGDRQRVAEAARCVGVSAIVVPSVDRASFAAVRACCTDLPGCFPAYGIHPLYVAQAAETDLERLREQLAESRSGRPPAVAVGEIGLDRFVAEPDLARQEFFFVEQLRIARQVQLPVLLHVRRAVDLVLAHLRRIPVPGGIAHAFNGSRQQADELIRLGFRLGFGGAVTHSRSTRIRQLATCLPLEAIVLETDSPDMPPEWLAGARNTPDQLPRINALLAGLRGIPARELARATSANAAAVLPELRLPT